MPLSVYVRVREALRPYLRQILDDASATGLPLLRAMFLEFPDDAIAWQVSDQYMFGRDLLVAPVVEPGASKRNVYLPVADSWTDVRTGDVIEGRGIVEVEAPIGVIPVFARNRTAPDLLDRLRQAWTAG